MFQELLPYEGNISRLILSNATGSRQLSRNYFEGLPDLKLTNLQALVVLEDSAYNYSIFRLLNMASHSKCTDMALRFTWYDFRSISTLTELQIMQRVTTLKIKLRKDAVFRGTFLFLNSSLTRQSTCSDTPVGTFRFSP